MERHELRIRIDVGSTDLADVVKQEITALLNNHRILVEAYMHQIGYIHPDGQVRECPLPPLGFSVVERVETYEGVFDLVPPERIYVLIPEGIIYSDSDFEENKPLPLRAKRWNYGEWKEVLPK